MIQTKAEYGLARAKVSPLLSTSTLSGSPAPSSPPTSFSSFCIDVQRIYSTSDSPDFHLASSHAVNLVSLPRGPSVAATVAALPFDGQSAFYALFNAYIDEDEETGIFDTNGFSLSSSRPTFGIFCLTARLNHSCLPNVNASYDSRSRRMRTHALRTIEPGEELLTAYLGRRDLYGLESSKRRDRLRKRWNFDCRCEVCAAPRPASDRRSTRLGELRDGGAGLQPRDVEGRLRACGEALALLEAEQIRLDGDDFALAAARACAFAQDYASARVWARLGWKSAREEYGVESALAKRLEVVVREPRELLPPGLKGERRKLGRLTEEVLSQWIDLDPAEGGSLFTKLGSRLRGLFVASPSME
ncbi:hypothetical protein JCM21900_005954 [Sporobolomyces salmonicolor]